MNKIIDYFDYQMTKKQLIKLIKILQKDITKEHFDEDEFNTEYIKKFVKENKLKKIKKIK